MTPIVGIGFGPGATPAFVVTLGFGIAVPVIGVVPIVYDNLEFNVVSDVIEYGVP